MTSSIMPPEVFRVAGALGNHVAYAGKKEDAMLKSIVLLPAHLGVEGTK